MKMLVQHLVESLVDHTEKVEISIVEDEQNITIKLKVDTSDMGKVIGKNGRIANALRVLLKAVGVRNQKKVFVEIVD